MARRRQVGNFPQAFSHLAFIQAASFINQADQRTKQR
jgi:GH15 family glucan-1,4-alpha-glucosidase